MELSKRYPVKIRGCYLLWKNDSVVYVGQSEHIIRRITQHKKDFDEYSYVELKEGDLNELEADLIVTYNPPLNCTMPTSKKYVVTVPSWGFFAPFTLNPGAIPVLHHPKIGKVYKVDDLPKKKKIGKLWWHNKDGRAVCGKCYYGEFIEWLPSSKDAYCPRCNFTGKAIQWNATMEE